MKTVPFYQLKDGETFKLKVDSKFYQKVLEDDPNVTAFEINKSSIGLYVPDDCQVLISE